MSLIRPITRCKDRLTKAAGHINSLKALLAAEQADLNTLQTELADANKNLAEYEPKMSNPDLSSSGLTDVCTKVAEARAVIALNTGHHIDSATKVIASYEEKLAEAYSAHEALTTELAARSEIYQKALKSHLRRCKKHGWADSRIKK